MEDIYYPSASSPSYSYSFFNWGFHAAISNGQMSDISPWVIFVFIYGSNKIIQKGIDEGLQSKAVDAGKKKPNTHTHKKDFFTLSYYFDKTQKSPN